MKKIGHVTILVNDFDEALDFYKTKLGFEVRADDSFGEGQRWVSVAPSPEAELAIVFVLADTDEKRERVGSQVADHVFLVLETEDVQQDFERLRAAGVEFHGEPRQMPWGAEVVFEDLYGNVIDLLQPAF